MLLSLTGVGSIVATQWYTTLEENAARLESLFDSECVCVCSGLAVSPVSSFFAPSHQTPCGWQVELSHRTITYLKLIWWVFVYGHMVRIGFIWWETLPQDMAICSYINHGEKNPLDVTYICTDTLLRSVKIPFLLCFKWKTISWFSPFHGESTRLYSWYFPVFQNFD